LLQKLVRFSLIAVLLLSCDDNEDEGLLACSCLGPSFFAFEVLQDDLNVFENDVYSLDDISVDGDSNPADFVLSNQEIDYSFDGSDIHPILNIEHKN